jgi:DNA-binding MarR family transcriptional regulator
MGTIQDLLQEVPLSAVLKERVALAEQKYEIAMKENAELKQNLRALQEENVALHRLSPKQERAGLSDDSTAVLRYLFRAEGDARDIGIMARTLQMEKGLVKYHLDQLAEVEMAECIGGNYVDGHIYWALTPTGRKHAVETKLI